LLAWEEIAEGLESSAHVDRILQQVRLTLIPKQVAWETSRIQRELAVRGRRLGENDAWLAGTARSWGMRLVTNDGRFEDVPRLRVIHY
jgi:predicted nucleic acid-binding protein